MQYNIYINQLKAQEWGLNLQQATLFSFIYELPSWSDCHTIGGIAWHRITKGKLAKELPILTSKPDTIYRQMRILVDAGLIEVNHQGSLTLVRITPKGAGWNRDLGNFSEGSEKNPSVPSEKFPTYHNTIIHHLTTPPTPQCCDDGGVMVTAEEKIREYVLLAEKHGAAKNPAGLALHLQRQGSLNEFHLAQLAAWRQEEIKAAEAKKRQKNASDAPCPTVDSLAWNYAKELLKNSIKKEDFRTWIEPLRCIQDDGTGEVILAGLDPYYCSWVKDKYLPQILETMVSREVRVVPWRN